MSKQRVAIIGGGIFGITVAIELAKFFQVDLLERRAGLLEEGSYTNQYRHHYGYHYPRSPETVEQCFLAKDDFESLWGETLITSFPAYYCIAKEGSKTSAQECFSLWDRFNLPYEIGYPEAGFLNHDAVELSVKTPEPVYDYKLLRRLSYEKLYVANVTVKLSHDVINCVITSVGSKVLTISVGGNLINETYDYVINATYANFNVFSNWLGIAARPIEFRYKEFLVIKIPGVTPVAITVIDGPFTTLVPMDKQCNFTFGDIPRSIHDTRISTGGVPWTTKELLRYTSRWQEMFKANTYFFPILKNASYLKSIWGILPIKPNSDVTDGRPTEIINHGSGCWSVFEGKIITCVLAARKIAREIK